MKDMNRRIASLSSTHSSLEKRIVEMTAEGNDGIAIVELKKKKLRIKDELSSLSRGS